MNCEFSDPVNISPDPEKDPQWSYQKAVCQTEEIVLIENPTTEAEFYLDKKISYGDLIIIILGILFLVWAIAYTTGKFVFKRD